MNHSIAENFMRSAKAPAISAGVMMANVIWNAQNKMKGMVRNLKNSPPPAPWPTSVNHA